MWHTCGDCCANVTKIQAQAFYKAINLTSLTLHEGIVSIGADAFYNCKNLATVINHSSLKLTMGTTGWGYVARYATTVVNTKYDA